jgi:hypothetical protein
MLYKGTKIIIMTIENDYAFDASNKVITTCITTDHLYCNGIMNIYLRV